MKKLSEIVYHGFFILLMITPVVIIGVIIRNFVIAPEINWLIIRENIAMFFISAGAWMLLLVSWAFMPKR